VKQAVIDASSAILLAKTGIFFKIADGFDLCMAHHVYYELTHKRRPFAGLFAKCLEQGRVKKIVLPSPLLSAFKEDARLAGLDRGERETIQVYFGGKNDFIIIDDRKGAAYCRDRKIPYINALLCPKILFFMGYINEKACRRFFAHLRKIGRYAPWVLKKAEVLTKEDLVDFL
jgi:hypothetical protein